MNDKTRSNCLFYALPRWLRKAAAGEETYLMFRLSRVRWGFFHCLCGTLDPASGMIRPTSYKPPPGHVKSGFAPVFHGAVVDGDDPRDAINPQEDTDDKRRI